MTLVALISGLGLYFAIPIGLFLLPLVTTPIAFFAVMAAILKDEPETVTLPPLRVDPLPMSTASINESVPWPADELTDDAQIRELKGRAIPELLERLPSDGSHTALFESREGEWHFHFQFISLNARFTANGTGPSPKEAFTVALHILNREIREWHEARTQGRIYVASRAEGLPWPDEMRRPTAGRKPPRVMIIDDDVDIATGLQAIFQQFGCETEVVTRTEDMHRIMSFRDADFIVLDWMLSERLRANQVIEKATRIIDSFSDLRERFRHKHPKIVTYSVLDQSQIALPENPYFDHFDHWQKPIQFSELSARTSELLETHGLQAH
jgi:CheY-like chemotaxis protein